MTHTLTLRDGRTLAYEEYGDPEGTPVLSFHGGLSSRLDASPAAQAATELNIRLISPDRPGMGLSTNQKDRTLLDWPNDVEQLANALALEHFAIMGWSAGGAYAAVTAAKLGDRTTSVALLSSAVPLDKFGTTKGLSSEDRILLFLTIHAPRIASAVMHLAIGGASEARLYRELVRSFPPVDRAVLREHRGDAVAMIKESMRHGTAGCLQDYRIFGAPWGFELSEVVAPTHIWEGSDDHTGPPDYREYLATHIPHATVNVVPDEGHLSLLPHHAGEILGALVTTAPA
jgi:pimeloyl-ACP methyl ester carboxylesterase